MYYTIIAVVIAYLYWQVLQMNTHLCADNLSKYNLINFNISIEY